MTLYRVTITQTSSATVYVIGDSPSAAEEDAGELCAPEFFGVEQEDIQVDEVDSTGPFSEVWTGGPDGDWAPWPPRKTSARPAPT